MTPLIKTLAIFNLYNTLLIYTPQKESMTAEETLALYAQGRDAWNKWAGEMLATKEDSREWEDNVKASFKMTRFANEAMFRGFIFPGKISFIDIETFA
jgi:hypothetical protein